LHAGFGGGHSEQGSNAPRRVPTLLVAQREVGDGLITNDMYK
jgi:hypothetical protein